MIDGTKRVMIENVAPQIAYGEYPIKRAVGESVRISADIYADGHDELRAFLLHRKEGDAFFHETPMIPLENDRWTAEFQILEMVPYYYGVKAWVDRFKTWSRDMSGRIRAGQNISAALAEGARLVGEAAARASGADRESLRRSAATLEGTDPEEALSEALSSSLAEIMAKYGDLFPSRYEKELMVLVDPPRALFSTWYEFFPRSAASFGSRPRHGTFRDMEKLLPEIARMGFDVLYFPPIHPIGETHRKGRNNEPRCEAGDVGSPWAIGSESGGHKAVHPELGNLEEFRHLCAEAGNLGLEIALDMAFQCSPDHPYVREHPEWFRRRADGSIQYAENPPKKYEDIYPFDFECEAWRELWEELRSVFLFWVEQGVRIFRVDNPHTKPVPFWRWVISEVKQRHPETIFLAEAFTRPKMMYGLAKAGFTQSYTYFTWRNTKKELTNYMTELVEEAPRDYFRPNFWPNTPDILPEFLQFGGRPAFIMRLVLAATLSSNYGIYGPAFELCENEARVGSEEYLNSEKYEIRPRNWNMEGNLKDFIARLNGIRRNNSALQTTWNLRFIEAENDFVIAYVKVSRDTENAVFTVVNLDPYNTQGAWITLPLEELELKEGRPFLIHDLLGDDKFIWHGGRNYVELNPRVLPARIFTLKKDLRKETDFDYFM